MYFAHSLIFMCRALSEYYIIFIILLLLFLLLSLLSALCWLWCFKDSVKFGYQPFLSKFLAITCALLKPLEKLHAESAIGTGFASHWLKNWHKNFFSKSQSLAIAMTIIFHSHLKTALCNKHFQLYVARLIIN